MSSRGVLYDVFAAQAEALAGSIPDDLPEHRFSLSYRHKERAVLKAYERSRRQNNDFTGTYRKMQLWKRLRLVFIVVITALFLTGSGFLIVHYIGGLRFEQHSTHTNAFAVDTENADTSMDRKLRITYDMSRYNKEIMSDDEIEYWEIYRDESRNVSISFKYMPDEYYENIRYNTEDSKIENVNINGHEAFYFTAKNGLHCYTWNSGEYVIDFDYAGISYDEAMEIINSIEALHKFIISYDLSDYTEEVVCDDEIEYWVLYRKGDDCVNFRYMPKEYYGIVRYNTEGSAVETKYINGHEAFYFETKKGGHCLVWEDGDYVIDFDYAGIGYDEAVEIIESVKENK